MPQSSSERGHPCKATKQPAMNSAITVFQRKTAASVAAAGASPCGTPARQNREFTNYLSRFDRT